jgi:hypothetical protein
MNSFHIKSIILGIGIGIVMTSIISIIYFAGVVPEKLSKEEIIQLAEKYGMVKSESIIKDNAEGQGIQTENAQKENLSSSTNKQEVSTKPSTAETKPAETKPAETKPSVGTVLVIVNQGDSSEKVGEKLVYAGLIKDKRLFTDEIGKRGLSGSIEVGEYKINNGEDIDTIIKALTR